MPLEPSDLEPVIAATQANGETLELMRALLVRLVGFAEQGALPPSAVLSQEFMLRSDRDQGRGPGGSIYGVDWGLDPEDPHIPPVLVPLFDHPNWLSPAKTYTWAEYLALEAGQE